MDKVKRKRENLEDAYRRQIRFSKDMLEDINKIKGEQSFSVWVREACEMRLKYSC